MTAKTEDALSETQSIAEQSELSARYEMLRRAEQAAGVGVWDIDVLCDTVTGTSQFFRIMGLEPRSEPVAMDVLRSLRIAEDRERVNRGYRDAANAGVDVYESEYRIRRPDGQMRWIWGRGKIVRDRSGSPVRYSGADIDVTERKAFEQALVNSETRLRIAVEAANLGIWEWDLLTNEMTWSDTAKAIAGFPAGRPVTFEDVRNVTCSDDLPRTSAMARRALDPAVRSKEPYEYRLLRRDGTIRWVLAHGEAVFADVEGGVQAIRYTGTIQDITSRKEAETRLSESEAHLRLAVEAGRLGVWEYDAATDTIKSSPGLNRVLGIPENKVVAVGEIEARYPPGERQRVRSMGEAALARGERHFETEFRLLAMDGTICWFLLRADFLFSSDGVPSGALGVLVDITERKKSEEQRLLLARELQHRVNNTLALVAAIAGQTFKAIPGKAASSVAATFTERLAALGQAHRLLTQEKWHGANFGDIVRAALAPYRDKRHIEISGPPDIRLDSRRALSLSLALNELATNAVKYGALSTDDGRIVVAWKVESLDDVPKLTFRWEEIGGPKVSSPRRRGFGTRLISEVFATDFNGRVDVEYAASGLVCVLECPVPHKAQEGDA